MSRKHKRLPSVFILNLSGVFWFVHYPWIHSKSADNKPGQLEPVHGHVSSLQWRVMTSSPTQLFPPLAGLGLLQVLKKTCNTTLVYYMLITLKLNFIFDLVIKKKEFKSSQYVIKLLRYNAFFSFLTWLWLGFDNI